MNKILTKYLIFDWGDTVMRDFALEGPMWKWEKVDWIPGVENALIKLYKNYTCVIATSADHSDTDDMKKALKRVGADKYFTHFFSQKELGFKKPDVRFFKSVAEKINEKPKNCTMIGNNYVKDIIGAKDAGMKTIFFNEEKLERGFPKADVVIHRMDDIEKYF